MATINACRGANCAFARGAWVLVLLATVGCDRPRRADYSSLGLVPVTGAVRLDGAPVVGATVVFENQDGTFSTGKTDAAGQYRLMFNSEQPGIAPGKKKVRITSRGAGESPEDAVPGTETIPPRYNVRSQQVVEVTNDARAFDFDLESRQ